ncbi:hypothetical protein NHG25_05975 [Aerococcaceae bacterium NML191292]|nr:hypothetical protein [Aerococcaceae bacterium NML191292]
MNPTTNEQFVYETQPIGNIRFLDNMIQTGNTYMTTLYVWHYPSEVSHLWHDSIQSLPNCFVINDIAYQETGESLKKLRKAIREQYSRFVSEREAYDKAIAEEEYFELNEMAKYIRKNQESIKYMCTRILIFAETVNQLDQRIVEVKRHLERNEFGATVLLMEQEHEYQAIFLDHNAQSHLPNKRVGRDVPSSLVSTTFPANHVSLMDPRGMHLGYSLTGGNIILDFFELDSVYRKQYNIIIFGEPGGGKSTFIKKVLRNLAARNYFLRGFDKSGEFRALLEHLGCPIVALDGSEGKINIFQIFPTAVDDRTMLIDESASFTQHKAKIATWYSVLKPGVDHGELDVFELFLDKFYVEHGFDESKEDTVYTTLSNEEYPILADFIALLERDIEAKAWKDFQLKELERIYNTMLKLQRAYGKIFNGHTSIENVLTDQMLFFNIDGLMAMGNKQIADAQLFNAMSLIWASLISHGKEQVRLYKKREVDFDGIQRAMLFIDECHNLVNKDNPRMTRFVNTIQREGRKLFVGVLLATQAISTLVPENATSEESDLLRELYSFSQYKIFFQIESNHIPHLQKLTQYSITDSQISHVTGYRQGRCLLSMTGGMSIEMDVDASDYELELFSGGGKNAEDR